MGQSGVFQFTVQIRVISISISLSCEDQENGAKQNEAQDTTDSFDIPHLLVFIFISFSSFSQLPLLLLSLGTCCCLISPVSSSSPVSHSSLTSWTFLLSSCFMFLNLYCYPNSHFQMSHSSKPLVLQDYNMNATCLLHIS